MANKQSGSLSLPLCYSGGHAALVKPHLEDADLRFYPPLVLKGGVVVRMVSHGEGRRPGLQASVLDCPEGATRETAERNAGSAFRGSAEAERLIVKSGE